MSVAEFLSDPWNKSHPTYGGSVFNIYPKPEYANSEVLVASLYRAVGFNGQSEAQVPVTGRRFEKAMRNPQSSAKVGSDFPSESWSTVLHSAIESPKTHNQSKRRLLQLTPIVPDVSLYSGSARATEKSWNPGLLVKRMVRLGSMTDGAAEQLWKSLFDALDVTDNDDIWARWLHGEFVKRRQDDFKWAYVPLGDQPDIPFAEKSQLRFPAQQFVRDLKAVIAVKERMTRRQWISLMEAIIRLGCVTHVLWLCDVSDRLWRVAREVLDGAVVPDEEELGDRLFSPTSSYLVHGNPALRIIRNYASSYLVARLGINLLSWHIDPEGQNRNPMLSRGDLRSFLLEVEASVPSLASKNIIGDLNDLHDEHARTLACKKGIGSNLADFGRHALGQRLPANESLRGYDQGYFLKKKGRHASAPWVVSLGPVAILALVHCCLDDVAGPRSVERLCQHLARYRLGVDVDDISNSDFGRNLRMLGLVLDSPDAESGVLLVPPFQASDLSLRARP